jgi:autophagy-related protein 17
MASLLDSLVSHFDLCVSAIKHTEGGVTAVQDAANAHLITLSGVMGSPSNSTHLTPISDEDRAEMLAVVSNDASEVEDVVLELQQRLANMEETLDGIVSHVNSLTEEYTSTTSAFALLDSISAKMPTYIQHSATYLATWDGHKSQIISLMDELEHTRVFYEGYLTSYDGLILEVERRRKVEDKMKSVLRKAMEHVEKLARDDHKEREGFRKEAGDYLPGDLWPGLRGDAPQWEIGIVGPEGADEATAYGGEETPELGKGIVEAAVRRDRERSRS